MTARPKPDYSAENDKLGGKAMQRRAIRLAAILLALALAVARPAAAEDLQ
jgi:hypothetical protein